MNRLLFYIGLTLLISILLASFLNFNINIVLSLLLIITLPFFQWIFKYKLNIKFLSIMFITVSVGFFSYSLKDNFEFNKLLALDDKNVIIEGVITSHPEYNDKSVIYNVKVDKISVKQIYKSFKTKLYLKDGAVLEPYSRVKAKVKCFSPYLKAPKKLKRYYKCKNQAISLFSYNDDDFEFIDKTIKTDIVPKLVLDVKKYLKYNLTNCFKGDQGNIMVGMLLGDKSGIDYQIRRDFSLAGISHLLAVSGLHMTILIQTIYSVLRILKLRNKKIIIISIFFTVFFMAVTSFSPSAVRAGIMNIIYFLGLMLKRESDALSSLGLALIIILMVNPFSALDVGLHLSFAAALSIILFKQKVYNNIYKQFVDLKNKKIDQFIGETFSVSLSALVLTTPITAIEFGRISILAPITNVILTPVIEPTIVLIAMTSLLGGIKYLDLIYKLFAVLSSIGVDIIKGIANIIANIPFSSVSVDKKYLYIWFISILILLFVNKYILKNQRMNRYIFMFCIIILLAGKLSNDVFMIGQVNAENVGDKNKNYIVSDSKVSILVLRENDKYLLPNIDDEMKKYGINHLNYVVLSENIEMDEIIKLISIYKPNKILLDDKTKSLLEKKLTNSKENLKLIKNEKSNFILQEKFFKDNKTFLKIINTDEIVITNKSGRLNILKR